MRRRRGRRLFLTKPVSLRAEVLLPLSITLESLNSSQSEILLGFLGDLIVSKSKTQRLLSFLESVSRPLFRTRRVFSASAATNFPN